MLLELQMIIGEGEVLLLLLSSGEAEDRSSRDKYLKFGLPSPFNVQDKIQ